MIEQFFTIDSVFSGCLSNRTTTFRKATQPRVIVPGTIDKDGLYFFATFRNDGEI